MTHQGGIIDRSQPHHGQGHSNDGGSAVAVGMFVMFERNLLARFITPPGRAKRAVVAAAAGLAAGGRAAVSSPLRALTAQRTCICRVLLRISLLKYPHNFMAWRIFTFTAGSGFCLHAKKKRAAFATCESSFSPFLFEDIWQYGNELQ